MVREITDIKTIVQGLNNVVDNKEYKFGIAGSFARNEQTATSDVDIIISGAKMILVDDYNKIYRYLLENLGLEFDLINLEALEEEDKDFDDMLIDMGLDINDESAYKNIKKDVIWVE